MKAKTNGILCRVLRIIVYEFGKNANSKGYDDKFLFSNAVCVVTTGVCVFHCADFGWRVFYFTGGFMKKRVTNEQVAQFIVQCATDVEFECLFEISSAQSAMVRAENRFIESLTHEQKELYEKYLQEKQDYIDVVAQRYKKLK